MYLTAPFLWSDQCGQTRYSVRPINLQLSKKEKKDLQTIHPSKYSLKMLSWQNPDFAFGFSRIECCKLYV